MTEEDRTKIVEKIKEQNRTKYLNNHFLNEAVSIVNCIITNPIYKNENIVNNNDLEFTDSMFGAKNLVSSRIENVDSNGDKIIEIQYSSNNKISQILFDIYYPKCSEDSYYHFTKISALRNILKGELKLKPLISNDNYDEFKSFYEDHNILGYFNEKDYDGTLLKDALMKEIYIFCMASKTNLTEENENVLWRSFADNGYGVRIEFEIETNHPDFRKIFYKDKNFDNKDLVINRIQSITKNLYNKEFFIPGISKIGAFYLPGSYKIENEVRFIIKKHTDEYEFNLDDSNGYIILPFKSEYAEFKIKKIKFGEKCNEENKTEIFQLIKENGYNDIIIE